jgi:hypothetical protein
MKLECGAALLAGAHFPILQNAVADPHRLAAVFADDHPKDVVQRKIFHRRLLVAILAHYFYISYHVSEKDYHLFKFLEIRLAIFEMSEFSIRSA